MSKKKASGGSTTMTLKDFHGGSIPSDLPLPSAPGAMARPRDRPAFDRQGSWGNPMGRSDRRPGSAGAVRNFDDKAPFLTPNAHIGRNFDEDERKPLDGASGPRRTVSDESICALPSRTGLKPDYSSTGRMHGRQVPPPVSQSSLSSSGPSSYAGRVAEAGYVGMNSQKIGGNSSVTFAEVADVGVNSSNLVGSSVQPASATYPNVWAMRKEVVSPTEPLPATWTGLNAASKLVHASALEKVSSGRWHSKQPFHHPTDVEVNRHTPMESTFCSKAEGSYNESRYHPEDVAGGMEYHDAMLAKNAEKSLTVDDRELANYERPRSPIFPETIKSNPPSHVDGVRLANNDGKFGGSELQSPAHSEQSERPKLRLLPRSKQLESLELPVDHKQGYQQSQNFGNQEGFAESYGNENPTKFGLAGSDSGNRAVERPKLNLKPRSQPLEQVEGKTERERNSVFGGARPREMVLKDRVIDDVAVHNHDVVQPPNWIKQDALRSEIASRNSTSTRYNGKAENIDGRTRKNNDRRDNRLDVENADIPRRNWRSENRRNNRETENHQNPHTHQQQPQERQPSPETWRKPAEQLKPASPDAPRLRFGKAASAVDLAQAFSRSASDPKTADGFPGRRGIPGRVQMPFSRLMDPTSRPQINGY